MIKEADSQEISSEELDIRGEDDGVPIGISGMFWDLADLEDQLGTKTQHMLAGMGRGPAAELQGKVVDRGGKVRNPERCIAASLDKKKAEEEKEGLRYSGNTADEESIKVRLSQVGVRHPRSVPRVLHR